MKEIHGLNWLRGISAILVLLSHARSFFYVNFPDYLGNQFLGKIFYLITGLGTSAVIIFFVLSGYLVAGSLHRNYSNGKWDKYNYLSSRLSRLWIVFIPCLLMTLVLDQLGYRISPEFYRGDLSGEIYSGPKGNTDWSLSTFIGNILFLQTIYFPVFGSNGPFWSLANEFWYYILFPFLFFIFIDKKNKFLYFVFFIVICIFVGWDVIKLFPIWLLGYLSFVFKDSFFLNILQKNKYISLGGVLVFVGAVFVVRILGIQDSLFGYYLIGILSSMLIFSLHHPIFCNFKNISGFISKISYSLYLVHFPILTFIFTCTGLVRYNSILSGFLIFLFSILISFFVAYAFWYFFEKNTIKLKLLIDSIFTYLRKRIKNVYSND